MRVMTVVGARPQFVKAAVVSHELRKSHEEILVHTGQHYDHGMSARFFDELDIPAPDHNLGIAGGPHGQMTGRMLEQIEAVAVQRSPDRILVYGDTNSTVAAALAGAKLHIPVAHVEAGLRSFNRRMPEEINRVVTDHLSSMLLCPTDTAVELLRQEGITAGVHNVGDVMYDSVIANLARARLGPLPFTPPPAPYAFATVHRPENTNAPTRLRGIIEGLGAIGIPVILPLHPRTRAALAELAPPCNMPDNVRVVDPVGYLDVLRLVDGAAVVLTDSGGLQKEAFFLGVRCVTMRDETEWAETVEVGANELVGADATRIAAATAGALERGRLPKSDGPGPFGDGTAAAKIVSILTR